MATRGGTGATGPKVVPTGGGTGATGPKVVPTGGDTGATGPKVVPTGGCSISSSFYTGQGQEAGTEGRGNGDLSVPKRECTMMPCMDGEARTEADRQTDRPTDKQASKQAGKQTNTQTALAT